MKHHSSTRNPVVAILLQHNHTHSSSCAELELHFKYY